MRHLLHLSVLVRVVLPDKELHAGGALQVVEARLRAVVLEQLDQLLPEIVLRAAVLGDLRDHRLVDGELGVHVKVAEDAVWATDVSGTVLKLSIKDLAIRLQIVPWLVVELVL